LGGPREVHFFSQHYDRLQVTRINAGEHCSNPKGTFCHKYSLRPKKRCRITLKRAVHNKVLIKESMSQVKLLVLEMQSRQRFQRKVIRSESRTGFPFRR
jgi:hypothetical protein